MYVTIQFEFEWGRRSERRAQTEGYDDAWKILFKVSAIEISFFIYVTIRGNNKKGEKNILISRSNNPVKCRLAALL
jgi:hypothetical protein